MASSMISKISENIWTLSKNNWGELMRVSTLCKSITSGKLVVRALLTFNVFT